MRAALYLDSDVYIFRANATLDELARGRRVSGIIPASEAALVLGSNRPIPHWADKPCDGMVLLRPASGATDLLRRWWDTPGPARVHGYEQDALYSLLDGRGPPRCGEPRWLDVLAVVDTPQFPPCASEQWEQQGGRPEDAYAWGPASFADHTHDLWGGFAKRPQYQPIRSGGRAGTMRRHIASLGLGLNDADAFARAVRDIRVVTVDVVALALAMHEESCDVQRACEAVARPKA